jgi:hypothetical protein
VVAPVSRIAPKDRTKDQWIDLLASPTGLGSDSTPVRPIPVIPGRRGISVPSSDRQGNNAVTGREF